MTLLRSGGVAGDGLLDDNTRAACKKIQSIYKHVERLEAELSAARSSSGSQSSAEMQVASVRQEAQSTLRREVERAREEARVEFIRVKDERDLLEAECERLQDEIAAGIARCAGLERELAASSASTSMIKAELEALRGAVGDKEAELEAFGSKSAKMKQTVESQRREIKQMELEREQLRSKLEVKERQATVLENQTKKDREQLDRCKTETALLKTEVAHLKEDLEEQREAIAKTGGEGKQAKGELESLRRSNATFKSQVDEFRREATARDIELSAMSAEFAKVSSDLRTVKSERLELESEAQHIRVSLVFEDWKMCFQDQKIVKRASRSERLWDLCGKEVVESDIGRCLQEKVTRIEEELENALAEVNRGQKLLAEERKLLSTVRHEASVAKDDLARERSRVAGLDEDVAEARGQLKRMKEQNAAEVERLHGLVADKEKELDVVATEAKFSKVTSPSHVVSESERNQGGKCELLSVCLSVCLSVSLSVCAHGFLGLCFPLARHGADISAFPTCTTGRSRGRTEGKNCSRKEGIEPCI